MAKTKIATFKASSENAGRLALALARASMWFDFTPLPDARYQIRFKPAALPAVTFALTAAGATEKLVEDGE